jgi:signal transduction histidine kinase
MAKIVVIEDEEAILTDVLETLALEGYEVQGASNGRTGVNLVRQFRPDLVLCDIMMPDLDGYGVLMEVRSDPATTTTPFVFLTAKTDRDSMRRGMVLGADDYIPKPFTAIELLDAVRTRLERQAALAREMDQKVKALHDNVLLMMLPHELRTPLVSILGYSELLIADGEQLPGERVVEMAQCINRAGQRLHHLVENLLIYAQIEVLRATPERVKALRRLQYAYPRALLKHLAEEKAQQVGRSADLGLYLNDVEAVQIIEDNLRKIVAELLDNAFKFSQPGTPVQVSTFTENGHYVLQISDRGRGMTAEQIASISAYTQFDRKFYEQQGAGLGLVIAKHLTELHGGWLHIESQLEVGTTVQAALPLATTPL